MSPSVPPTAARRRALAALLALAVTMPTLAAPDLTTLRAQVDAAERSFAASMAQRDHAAFVAHLSAQAVFINGAEVLRGRAAVAAGWKPLFDAPAAPFSWEPDQIELLDDGSLAHSSGPVRNPAGQPVARFNSIWRQEAPGMWRIVFDKGQPWVALPPR